MYCGFRLIDEQHPREQGKECALHLLPSTGRLASASPVLVDLSMSQQTLVFLSCSEKKEEQEREYVQEKEEQERKKEERQEKRQHELALARLSQCQDITHAQHSHCSQICSHLEPQEGDLNQPWCVVIRIKGGGINGNGQLYYCMEFPIGISYCSLSFETVCPQAVSSAQHSLLEPSQSVVSSQLLPDHLS